MPERRFAPALVHVQCSQFARHLPEDLAVQVDSQQTKPLGYGPKRKNVEKYWGNMYENVASVVRIMQWGVDVWEKVTHLEGVASAPCLIDLRLDHWVLVRELEIIDKLRGAP